MERIIKIWQIEFGFLQNLVNLGHFFPRKILCIGQILAKLCQLFLEKHYAQLWIYPISDLFVCSVLCGVINENS